jgi:hypothetical protein
VKGLWSRSGASYALVFVGLLQAVGWAIGWDGLRGIGAVTAASPLPFVFSSFRNVETFAAEFEIELTREGGGVVRHIVTPKLYAELDGPYNRRNTYGAVLAYGPALTSPQEQALVDSVLRYGLCGRGPLARRFGETEAIVRVVVEVRGKGRLPAPPFQREISCSE